MKNSLVLVVDDEPEILAFLDAVLSEEKYEVKNAQNAQDAFACMDNVVPDALVLDLMMPGVDGFEVIRRVRADSRLAAVPIFVLSGCDDPASIQRGLQLGADQYLAKPFAPWELVARLAGLLKMIQFRKDLGTPGTVRAC
jgi:DNA-binding response OmpR family regulator